MKKKGKTLKQEEQVKLEALALTKEEEEEPKCVELTFDEWRNMHCYEVWHFIVGCLALFVVLLGILFMVYYIVICCRRKKPLPTFGSGFVATTIKIDFKNPDKASIKVDSARAESDDVQDGGVVDDITRGISGFDVSTDKLHKYHTKKISVDKKGDKFADPVSILKRAHTNRLT